MQNKGLALGSYDYEHMESLNIKLITLSYTELYNTTSCIQHEIYIRRNSVAMYNSKNHYKLLLPDAVHVG